MKSGPLIAKELLGLSRGWRITAYLAMTGILTIAFLTIITNQQKTASPTSNIMLAGLFINLQLLSCLVLFTADTISGETNSGALYLTLLLPQKRFRILLSKLVLPVAFFYIGLVIFTLFMMSTPNSTGFWKLWGARVLVDTLLFFALLFFTAFFSSALKKGSASAMLAVVLILLLFLSPYASLQLPYLGAVNPFALEYSIVSDLSDGVLDSPLPAIILGLYLVLSLIASYVVINRKEAED